MADEDQDWAEREPTVRVHLTGTSAERLWMARYSPNPLMWLFPAVRRG